jgi:CRP/FNR family transcriptional regulator, cyclic AMP receptor protein
MTNTTEPKIAKKRPRSGVSRNLQAAVIAKAVAAYGGKPITYGAKTPLYRQGEPVGPVYYIVGGNVQVTVVSKQGREGALATLAAGDFVGEATLTRNPLYLDSAVALTDCELLSIGTDRFRHSLTKSDALATYFTNFLLKRTLDVQAELIDHLFNSTEKRLARVLLLLANFGQEGRLEPIANVTQELLAQRVGTTRARISFFMNKFRRLGLIEYNGAIKVHSGLLSIVINETPSTNT